MTDTQHPVAVVEKREGLVALAERCEAASSSNDQLDSDIQIALGRFVPPKGFRQNAGNPWRWERDGVVAWQPSHHPTASLDAALALVGEKMKPGLLEVQGGWEPRVEEVWPAWTIRWYPPYVEVDGKSWHAIVASAATPALALCAALLRALAATRQEGADDGR